ncbi:hypothetical protein AV530_007591 [Patagioenas fasciata monilis]|uniref:Uncharacterized protein n=1 Tax=Patagioenas fasciata monilis TaxID=372326 RepID=A0A1V4JYB8_PATFA|nr:hypothetical protein AV530_007591 [Patagioenas fasciata monilis]
MFFEEQVVSSMMANATPIRPQPGSQSISQSVIIMKWPTGLNNSFGHLQRMHHQLKSLVAKVIRQIAHFSWCILADNRYAEYKTSSCFQKLWTWVSQIQIWEFVAKTLGSHCMRKCLTAKVIPLVSPYSRCLAHNKCFSRQQLSEKYLNQSPEKGNISFTWVECFCLQPDSSKGGKVNSKHSGNSKHCILSEVCSPAHGGGR